MVEINRAAGSEEVVDVVRAEKIKIEKLRKCMEDILYSYPRWRAEVVFAEEEYASLFPVLTVNYDFPESQRENGDQTFSAVARRMGAASEIKKKVEMVNIFLSSLDYEGRKFVGLKYFEKKSREKVMKELYISDGQYKIRRRMILDSLVSLLVRNAA